MKVKKAGKWIIVTVLVMHLLLISLAPLPQSVFYQSLPKVFILYLNQLGLNNPWNMFAPDPSVEQKISLAYFPTKKATEPTYVKEQPEGKLYGLSPIRSFYMLNYFMANDQRIFKELGPLVCRGVSSGYWELKTWIKVQDDFQMTRDMVLDCE